jgi:hypothetical protein
MAVEWTIRYPTMIIAQCSECKGIFYIEKPSPTTHILHCGNQRQRLPEKIYESWCDIRDNKKTNRKWPNAAPTENDIKVRSL